MESARVKVTAYEDWIKREQELYEREKIVNEKNVEVHRQEVEVTKKERDLAQEQARLYKDLYTSVSKKRGGFGCAMGKIFTLGIYRCK